MADYDIRKAFEKIENELIASMIRNMEKHREWEDEEGFQWEQWQALQLKELSAYRKRNKKLFGGEFKKINKHLEEAIRKAREEGNMQQELELLKMVRTGRFKKPKITKGMAETNAEFFKMNDRKMDALIQATVSDMEKAETAILRMANDKYRKVIFDAQVYANSGAGTYEKAIDMATRDFLAAGLNCVEYKNGARHTLKDYAEMALKTATKRAYLTGEGEKRKEWGISTVIMNKRGNPCPLCLPFVGKVMIDDVWSGGSSKDGKYPLMSAAISKGLYHPRCRDSHSTYFEGISTPPDDKFTKDEIKKIEEVNKAEAQKLHAQRQAEKYGRLAEYSLDKDNKKTYSNKEKTWENIEKSYEQSIIKSIKQPAQIPANCKHLLAAETNFDKYDIDVEVLNAIDEAIGNRKSVANDFIFDEIKVAKFADDDNSVFITNYEVLGGRKRVQLYLNKRFFAGQNLQTFNEMCMQHYESGWWKSETLHDLVNHEIMHARINFHNSLAKTERLYETLKEDDRVKGYCRLVDQQPAEFMNEMYVAMCNGEEINPKYIEVFREYEKEFLGG